MRATLLNCTLKRSPDQSNTELLLAVVRDTLEREGVETTTFRVVEDGAHHVIAELAQGMVDIGFTVPGQAWTYWNMGPGPGPSYGETDHGHEWSRRTGETAAQNLLRTARALRP